jgi:hypothetical protein
MLSYISRTCPEVVVNFLKVYPEPVTLRSRHRALKDRYKMFAEEEVLL